MAIFTTTTGSNWFLSLKVLLMSTGVLSVAMLLKLSVPLILEFAISGVPLLYSSVISWLRPPYLYILINFIIISIVASSKLQQKTDEDTDSPPPDIVSPPPAPTKLSADYVVPDDSVSTGYGFLACAPKVEDVCAVEAMPVRAYVPPLQEMRAPEAPEWNKRYEAMMNGVDLSSEERASPPPRNDSVENFSNWSDKENETPPVSARFAHRKSVKSSPEGKGLGVSKPKRQDTLESTWRTITEGRAMPLTRHLKKSDTLDSNARRNPGENDPNPDPMMKKSETFHDRSNNSKTPPSMRKEASLSQDELNRRVEAFIKKFNEDMRLQRQQSLSQYQEMIGRGGAN